MFRCLIPVLALLMTELPRANVPDAVSRHARKCHANSAVIELPQLPEASGIAASRQTPGRLWALNDSGQPLVVALNTDGAVTGSIGLAGVSVVDWEAIAVGPCPAGSCIYVADIGDNDRSRPYVTVYRVPEGAAARKPVAAEAFNGTYPDGPQDAESILVADDGRIYIVTKGSTGPIGIYRFRESEPSRAAVMLERVGKLRPAGKVEEKTRVTDATWSLDRKHVILRTRDSLFFYPAQRLFSGDWRADETFDLRSIGEPQGEGVTVAADGGIYLIGEGGGKPKPGTFAHIVCPPG